MVQPDLEPPMRDIIEMPDLCVVRESIVYELFASEERCWCVSDSLTKT